MKKILIIHTNYQNLGGEDTAVENEKYLLSQYYDVKTLYFQNDVDSFFSQAVAFLTNRNRQSMSVLQNEIDKFNPDLAYVHNTWFKGSLGIFDVLKKNNIKTFLKLHNFRYHCTKSFFSSNHLSNKNLASPKLGQNKIYCLACGANSESLGFFNKYYSTSYIKSFLVNLYGRKYFEYLKKGNIKIFVLTNFHRKYLLEIGVEEKRVVVFPNYLPKLQNSDETSSKTDNYLVYAGRVSEEKGVEELIESFLEAETRKYHLKIIGNGPILQLLKEKYKNLEYPRIDFLGEIENHKVLDIIKNSKGVITSTKLLEGQPMLLCEASILGVPSIFPKSGGISEFFPENYDLSFVQFDYNQLKSKINYLTSGKDFSNQESVDIKNQKSPGDRNKEYIEKYLDKKKLQISFEEYLNE
ncbi:glycosyltransferase family 4 protein [Acidimicrobiia bacterium]|nr:glycosyltransferase family 4 protein [Acidimicrobiia bacterium]